MNSLPKNYSVVIVSVLNHAWTTFGKFTPENHADVVKFVHTSMKEILAEQSAPKVERGNIVKSF